MFDWRQTPDPATRRIGAVVSAMALAVLGGCVLGLDYQRPASGLDTRFINAGARTSNAQPPAGEIATFWRGFNDARMNALIDRALSANSDIRIAQSRLQEARASQG